MKQPKQGGEMRLPQGETSLHTQRKREREGH